MLTHVDQAAFVRAICETPEDDSQRLVYADWLDEHDQPERAEFIRVQCELKTLRPPFAKCYDFAINMRTGERCGRCKDCSKQTDLNTRERILFRDSGREVRRIGNGTATIATWWEALPGSWRSTSDDMRIESADGFIFAVSRGFVSAITCTSAAFFGGACGTCHGDRGITERTPTEFGHLSTSRRCPACSGTGRRKGIAARLFREQPITSVTLTTPPERSMFTGQDWLDFVSRESDSSFAVAYGRSLVGLPPLKAANPLVR